MYVQCSASLKLINNVTICILVFGGEIFKLLTMYQTRKVYRAHTPLTVYVSSLI